MKLQWHITGWALLLLIGCSNDPENSLVQSIKIGEVKATAKPVSPTHEDYCYFNVRFEKATGARPAGEKVMYLNFDMQQDFTLVCAGDSISPAICQKIENGLSGSYEYMLAFDNSHRTMDKNDFTLLYKDKVFGIGVLAFVYRQKDIRKISRL
jgi:hypothetical protein